MMRFRLQTVFLIFLFLATTHIEANDVQVNMDTLDAFKSTFIADLPKGTPKDEIVKYLDRSSISYTDLDAKNLIYASIPKIGRYRLIYVTSLFIRIKLDDDERLQCIEFDLQHDGL